MSTPTRHRTGTTEKVNLGRLSPNAYRDTKGLTFVCGQCGCRSFPYRHQATVDTVGVEHLVVYPGPTSSSR